MFTKRKFREYTTRYVEGGRYRIQGSYGWAGILTGCIHLKRFVSPVEIPHVVQSYIRALDVENNPELKESAEQYRNEDWVEYEYEQGGEKGTLYLPFEEFAQHASII